MKQYVMILSIGPVQDFIAAARRSRDLWCGSWLLSELAKSAAFSLFNGNAELIFPAINEKNSAFLMPNSNFSVGNKLQAVVQASTIEEITDIVKNTKEAIQNRFEEEAKRSKQRLKASLREEIWDKQIKDYVEVQGAWAEIQESYSAAVEEASRLLAARKATRDFKPSALSAFDSTYMIPKSSLDGARETVLPESLQKEGRAQRILSLSDGEQLDSVGVIKRLSGNIDQFTPYTRIAADSWVKTLVEAGYQKELKELGEIYSTLVDLGLATRVSGNNGHYGDFPFDGQYLYSFRVEAALSKAPRLSKEREAFKTLETNLRPIWKKFGDPCPYSVLLLADGDKMGELLDNAQTIEEHKKITAALSDFAGSVTSKMREFDGHTIYAGGDDVLGFVPLNRAYECAKSLSEQFLHYLAPIAEELSNAHGKVINAPTLSVGLAITHINTPLGHIRNLAAQAEKIAKGDVVAPLEEQRNAVGITLAVRSGSTTHMRLRWDDEQGHKALKEWIKYYRGDDLDLGAERLLTSRIAYDTREIALNTDFYLESDEEELIGKIQKAEFARMLEHARTQSGKRLIPELKTQLTQRLEQLESLEALSTELIIARWLSVKTARDVGRMQ